MSQVSTQLLLPFLNFIRLQKDTAAAAATDDDDDVDDDDGVDRLGLCIADALFPR